MKDGKYHKMLKEEEEFWDRMTPFKKSEREQIYMWDNPIINDICTGYYERRLIELASKKPGGRVLEVACGTGWLALELGKRGMRVEAYDLSRVRIEEAKCNLKKSKRRGEVRGEVKYGVKDLNTAVLPKERYDYIVSWGGLHHIPEVRKLVGRMRKALKKGGRVVFWDHFRQFGILNKIIIGSIYLLFPTNMSYAEKCKWYFQIALGKSSSDKYPQTQLSSFEDTGMKDLYPALVDNFVVIEQRDVLSFLRPIAGRLRLPKSFLYHTVKFLRKTDDFLVANKLLKGEYLFFYGRK